MGQGGHVAARQFGGAESAGDFMVIWYNDGFAGDVFEGGNDGAVERGAALEEDVFTDAAVADDAIEIVGDDGIRQAGDEVGPFGALLLVAEQV